MIRAFRGNSGFSLVELSIILAVVGLVGAALLTQYQDYLRVKIKNDTELHRKAVKEALEAFVINYNRLPCPADPALAPGAANAGLESCAAGGGLTEVQGTRQTAMNPAWTGFGPGPAYFPSNEGLSNKDPVLIGAVPYVTLGISFRDSLDGWGNKITYAMSKYLGTVGFNRYNGVIRILQQQSDETMAPILTEVSICPFGQHASCNPEGPLVDRPTAKMYVLISHGADGKGAWTAYGKQSVPCPVALIPSTAGARDDENCNGDSTFVDAGKETNIYSLVHTNFAAAVSPDRVDRYFDDPFTTFTIENSNDKWSYSSLTAIHNKTMGNVGIGLPNPAVPLDVDGNIKVEGALAGKVKSDQGFCTEAWDDPNTPASPDKPAYCFETALIAGADGDQDGYVPDKAMGCPGQYMTGIEKSQTDCDPGVDLSAVTPGPPCIAGQFMIGIDSSGGILCAAPP